MPNEYENNFEEEDNELFFPAKLLEDYEQFFERKKLSDGSTIFVEKFRQYGKITPTARYLLVDGLLGNIQTRAENKEKKIPVYDLELTEGIINQIKHSIKMHQTQDEDSVPYCEKFEIGENNSLIYTFFPCDSCKSFEDLKDFFDFKYYDEFLNDDIE
ncbi:hypothetical protein GX656_01950 [Candidatus Dojkabacteria bacterium]|uniref:Uncharacterized protein n=1 Tax=Candidatus Dojkabacteria bacterium TaxID=2099670 RepID=A0A847D1N3_9BACT|nr:hypothetical protein [Candidatus Dojkabacteria bacterium]